MARPQHRRRASQPERGRGGEGEGEGGVRLTRYRVRATSVLWTGHVSLSCCRPPLPRQTPARLTWQRAQEHPPVGTGIASDQV